MTKTQKIIILAAAVLIIATLFFPFYWEGQFGDNDKLFRAYLKWGFDPSLRDAFDDSVVGIWEYEKRQDIMLLEIVIILVVAAAGFQIARKKATDRVNRGRIKAQELIILTAAIIIVLAILFPPCNNFALSSKTRKVDKTGTGWAWILNTKERGDFVWRTYMLGDLDAEYPEIRYGPLGLEIFGILIMAGASLLITKKGNRN